MKKTRFDQLLSDQIGNGFAASQHYIAIAVWFDNRDLPQLAKHFNRQSIEERNHAMMLVQYRLDRDLGITIPGVDAVRNDFTDEREPIALALEQEKRVTQQVEEVASMTTLLAIMTRAENLFDVENYLVRESVGDASDNSAPEAAGGAL